MRYSRGLTASKNTVYGSVNATHMHAKHRMNSQVTSHPVVGWPVSFHAGGAPCDANAHAHAHSKSHRRGRQRKASRAHPARSAQHAETHPWELGVECREACADFVHNARRRNVDDSRAELA